MGKRADIVIGESFEYLNMLYRKNKKHRSRLRIKSLILTKNNKFGTRLELSEHLGIGLRTLFDRIELYRSGGPDALLASTSGGSRNRVITPELKRDMEKKLNDSKDPLQGYNDAVAWVRNEHGPDVNYHTSRAYMITNFGTELKVPRRSHYKKDEQAFEVFKKTS